jgi:hypothetical protein
MISRLLPQNWNDSLSIFVLVGIPLLWVAFTLPETVVGATITVWTLCAQFYYRRSAATVADPSDVRTLPPRG